MTAIRISGNRLVDQSGRQVVLRGVSHSGSEYHCLKSGDGVFGASCPPSYRVYA